MKIHVKFCCFIVCMLLPTMALAERCEGESWTPDSRFQLKNAEVHDKQTALVWKRCVEGMQWNGKTCIGNASFTSWRDAIQRYQASGDGWRLPNIDELATLRAGNKDDSSDAGPVRSGCWNPAINSKVFPGELEDFRVWSSSANSKDDTSAWAVDFGDGGVVNHEDRGEELPIRLVRGKPYVGPLLKSGKVSAK